MKKNIFKICITVIGAVLLQGNIFAQVLVTPSLADHLWVTSATAIAGINTAVMDIPIMTGPVVTSYSQLAACAYQNANGGVTVRDMLSGNMVNINYPVVGGITMASVPDVVIGNVTQTGTPGQDFIMAVAFINNQANIEIDYFDIHYTTLGTGGTFNATYHSNEIISFPPAGSPFQLQATRGTFSSLSTVHIDVVADPDPTKLIYGTPNCDRFFVVYDALFVPQFGGPNHSWVWASYGGTGIGGSPNGGLSQFRTNRQQMLGPSDHGWQPDVAGIMYDTTIAFLTAPYDVAWIAYVNSNVGGILATDDVSFMNWWPQLNSPFTPPSFYNTPPAVLDRYVNVTTPACAFAHPRIDADDDHTTNFGWGIDHFKVVYEADTTGGSNQGVSNASDAAVSLNIYSSNWIDLTSVTSSPPAPSAYTHYRPAVAYGSNSATEYMVTTATSVPGYGEYMMMEPITVGSPTVLATDPSSALSYFQVNTTAPADMASCTYANSVSTPCNNVSDSAVVAWAVYNSGVPNYQVYYKNTPYNGGGGTGYNYMPSHPSITPGITKQTDGLGVFPNPAYDRVTITNPADIHADRYLIKNMLGQVVKEGTITVGKNIVSVKDLAPGNYLATLYSAGTTCGTRLFVKNE